MSTVIGTDQFGRTISGTDNGDGTTTYDCGDGVTITFPNATSVADVLRTFNGLSPQIGNLSSEKQTKLTAFNNAVQTFISDVYDSDTQFRMFMLYYLAVQNSLPQRAAYLQPVLNWVQAVITYSATFTASVATQSDPVVVSGMLWDFTQVSVATPTATLLGAIQIVN